MSVSNLAVWPQTPVAATAVVTTANTAADGSGTITALVTAGGDGLRVDGLVVGARATVTATAVRFFISQDDGSTWTYLPELDALVGAHTLANTTANAGRVTVIDRTSETDYLDLAPGDRLGCTIAVALAGGMVFSLTGHTLTAAA